MPEATLSAPMDLAKGPTTDKPERPPTILAALMESTPEERKADKKVGDALAVALYEVMLRWAAAHEPIHREFDENWDFYRGLHYGYHSSALNYRVLLPEAPSNVIRLTYNYIRKGVNRIVSIILKDPPIIQCIAGTSEILDQAASEAAADVVEWRQQRTLLSGDAEQVAESAAVAHCWVHEEWDQSLGPMVQRVGPDGKPMFKTIDETSGLPLPNAIPDMVPQGDFTREILQHRQGVPDPSASHPFGGSAFFVRKRLSRFDLHRMRPDLDIDEIPPSGDERMKRVVDLGRGISSSAPANYSGVNPENRDEIECDICYIPKCPDYPRGRRILFTDRALLEETDNPRYPTEEEAKKGEAEPNPAERPCWPVFPFVHMFRAQSAFGYSPVHDAIQPNKAINGLGSMAMMEAAKAGKAKVKVPQGLGQQWSDETGQVFEVPRRGFDPNTLGYIAPPPMSQANILLWEKNKDALYEFLGLNQPAVGQQDTTGQSGYAIRLRQQTADNDLEKVRARHNNMWAEVYSYDLLLFARHGDTKRKIEILGENRRSALKELDRTAIMPGTNVRAVNDSSIPRNSTERMIFFQQLMQSGVNQLPPEQRQEMFQLLRLHDLKAFEERKQGDRMRADRQIRKIMGDEEPGQVSDMDDHLVQMAVLREFGLSEEFETKVAQELKASAPPPGSLMMPGMSGPTSPTFTRLMGLYEAHKQALMAQTMAQAPAPAPAVGAPVEPAEELSAQPGDGNRVANQQQPAAA